MSTAAPHIHLVAGATGTIGRLVVDELLSSGHKVRALTRSRSDAVLPAGVEIKAGNLDRPNLRKLSRLEARARWRAAGFSDEQIANLENFDSSEAARTVTHVVAGVTGRRPRSFDIWVDENLEAFR